MSKPNDLTEMSTVIEVEPNALELKSGIGMTNLCVLILNRFNFDYFFTCCWCFWLCVVNLANDADNAIETRSASADEQSTDETDQGCTNCSAIETAKSKERVSLSSSSDDETDQTISLAMNNKKSNSIAYKGKQFVYLFVVCG